MAKKMTKPDGESIADFLQASPNQEKEFACDMFWLNMETDVVSCWEDGSWTYDSDVDQLSPITEKEARKQIAEEGTDGAKELLATIDKKDAIEHLLVQARCVEQDSAKSIPIEGWLRGIEKSCKKLREMTKEKIGKIPVVTRAEVERRAVLAASAALQPWKP